MDTLRAPTEVVEAPSLPPPGLDRGREGGRATLPAPPPPGLTSLPPPLHEPSPALVLVATLDRSGIQSLTRRLLGRATVRGMRDPFELVYAIESHPGAQPVVVVDCCVPSVDPTAIATTVGALSTVPLVVLWGASEKVWRSVRQMTPAARNWIRLGPSATDADLSELVEALLW
ncbi:MAG: hypothetical protein ACODAU_00565 [Myxococcota bacterium]